MASLFTVICDRCNRDCSYLHIQVELVVEQPTMADDTQTKQYCSATCVELAVSKISGVPEYGRG